MSRAAKSNPDVPFEVAIGKLEEVLSEMEEADLPLEKLVAHFEEGTRLIQLCQAKLGEAELKISQLEKSSEGAVVKRAGAPGSEV